MTRRLPSVVMVGPLGGRAKGGIATVMGLLNRSNLLRDKYALRTVHTSDGTEGSLPTHVLLFLISSVELAVLCVRRAADVVHLHASSGASFWRKACLLSVAKVCGSRTVFHIHSGDFEYYCDNPSQLTSRAIGATLSRADVVVVLARWWKDALVTAYPALATRDVRVVCNPVRLPAIRPQRPNGHRSRLLFMGLLKQTKGVRELVEATRSAADRAADIEVVMCGVGPEMNALRQRVRALGIEDRVTFAGWVGDEEKPGYMEAADVFVLPSHREGMPIALLEAMAFGLPVLSTRIAAIPEIVEDGKNGFLIEPGDVEALAEKICVLASDRRLRDAMRAKNLADVTKFDVEQVAMVWDQLYEELTA